MPEPNILVNASVVTKTTMTDLEKLTIVTCHVQEIKNRNVAEHGLFRSIRQVSSMFLKCDKLCFYLEIKKGSKEIPSPTIE